METISEFCQATDRALCATKQTACTIHHFMAALFAMKRHLWLNLTGIKDTDKSFLLDTPISPKGGQ